MNDTAWILATNPNASVRDGAQAIELAQKALRLCGNSEPAILGTLAAAYAEAGRFDEAVATAKAAWHFATAAGKTSLANEIQERMQLYRQGKPYREPAVAPDHHHP